MARLARGVVVHGAGYPIHQQHGAAVGVKIDQLCDKVGIGTVGLHGQGDSHLAGNREIFAERLAAIDEPVVRQSLHCALIARPGIDQHIAPTEGWDWSARIIAVTTRRPARAIGAEIAVTAEIEPPRPRLRWRPALGMAPIVGYIGFAVFDPGARRIEYRWLVHDAGGPALQPIIEPCEIGIARPEIAVIDEIVLVGADPQLLIADA